MTLLETPGHSRASLGQSLVGSVHTRFCLCPARVCFPSPVSSGGSIVGLMVTSSKRAYAIPGAQGVIGGCVMPGLVLQWFPLCELSLFDFP